MGTIVAQDLIDDSVRPLLNDDSKVRWSDATLLLFINSAQLEIVNKRPDATAQTINHTLIPGIKQSIPADGIGAIDVLMNVGGNAIRKTMTRDMGAVLPSWPTDTASSQVENWMPISGNPREFYVYPPQPSASPGQVVLTYYNKPADVSALDQVIEIEDFFANAIAHWCLYKAFAQDTEFKDPLKAAHHYEMFISSLSA